LRGVGFYAEWDAFVTLCPIALDLLVNLGGCAQYAEYGLSLVNQLLLNFGSIRLSMSQSVDALWKSVVKLLQQLPAQGPEQRWDVSTIAHQIGVLVDKESLPRATMKHLIRELKVCVALLLGRVNAWQPVCCK